MRDQITTYRGKRHPGGCTVEVNDPDLDVIEQLDPRFDVRNHSPTGFEWGYAGSGPAQLALALLCDALGDVPRAERLYQRFKAGVITQLQHDDWAMSAGKIRELCNRYDGGPR